MDSSPLINALSGLSVILYRFFNVIIFVSPHSESFFANNWKLLKSVFRSFHVICNMCEKKEETFRFLFLTLTSLTFSTRNISRRCTGCYAKGRTHQSREASYVTAKKVKLSVLIATDIFFLIVLTRNITLYNNSFTQ